MKVIKNDKRFLSNIPHEYGTVCWEVIVDPEDGYDLMQADLRITDCSNTVNLSFSTRKEKHLLKRVEKIDNLIDALHDMREALVSAEVQEAIRLKVEAKEEKKDKSAE